jgi:glycosyltransferase involved in cell wall biosynthesis
MAGAPDSMRVLYISYPLLTVSEESAGGAEQILWTLERETALRGVETTVAASAGSRVAGELFSTGEPCGGLDDFERRSSEHQDRIVELVRLRARHGTPFDLVHDMSGSFWPRGSDIDAPLLATLHLPRRFYAPQLFEAVPGNVVFNCVSASQAAAFEGVSSGIPVVNNGIVLDRYEPNVHDEPRSGLLWLGRICEEKAPHLALAIALRAGMPVTIAGQVYPFSYHQRYFDREIRTRLQRMQEAEFVASPSAAIKRRLLRQAQAVLITSQAEETSSLVAMEAAASGTPVVAFARGNLPELIAEGVTGFLVNEIDEAVEALGRLNQIDSATCARHAHERFSSAVMTEGYAGLYAVLTGKADSRPRKRNYDARTQESSPW